MSYIQVLESLASSEQAGENDEPKEVTSPAAADDTLKGGDEQDDKLAEELPGLLRRLSLTIEHLQVSLKKDPVVREIEALPQAEHEQSQQKDEEANDEEMLEDVVEGGEEEKVEEEEEEVEEEEDEYHELHQGRNPKEEEDAYIDEENRTLAMNDTDESRLFDDFLEAQPPEMAMATVLELNPELAFAAMSP